MLQFVGRTTVSKKINKPQVHGKGPICGKNCTVLGLTDVAEVGVSVQDEVCHVVRVIRSPGGQGCDSIGLKVDWGDDWGAVWGAVLVLGGVGGAFWGAF